MLEINVAGQNSWDLSKSIDGNTTTHTAKFTVSEKGVDFGLTAVIANLQTKVPFDYGNCATGNGPCYNTTTANTTNCQGLEEGNGTCAEGFTLNEVNLTENALKFSIALSGVSFKDPSNKLTYGVIVKDKDGSTKPNVTDGKVSFPDGDIDYIKECVIELADNAGSTTKDVEVTTYNQGGKFYMDFIFSSFGENDTLLYDPDMTVNGADDEDDNGNENGGTGGGGNSGENNTNENGGGGDNDDNNADGSVSTSVVL